MGAIEGQEIDKLIKLRDAADRLGLSIGGIRGMILLRRIEFVKVGRAVRIKERTIRKLIDRGTVYLPRRDSVGAPIRHAASLEAIAKAEGMSIAAVHMCLTRALRKLRRQGLVCTARELAQELDRNRGQREIVD
jgi:excisionase family DNA binding protein